MIQQQINTLLADVSASLNACVALVIVVLGSIFVIAEGGEFLGPLAIVVGPAVGVARRSSAAFSPYSLTFATF